jgi:Undecaprenyl-phosphate galactose phosphotransferase WbaP
MATPAAVQEISAQDTTHSSIHVPQRPAFSTMLVLAADCVGLSFILWAFLSNPIIRRHAAYAGLVQLGWLLPIFLVLYWFFNAYPGVSISPVDEIRRISLADASAFLLVAVMLVSHGAPALSLLICLSACVGTTIVILAMRTLTRQVASRFDWWGYPVVLVGGGSGVRMVLNKLKSQPHIGLRPIAVVTDGTTDREMEGVAVWKSECLNQIASTGVRHAIVAAPELSQSDFVDMLDRTSDAFHNLILIPDTDFIFKVGSYSRDLMGVLGLQVRNNLLDRGSRLAKRTIDLACCAVLTIFLLPSMLFISFLVVMESGFPVFYTQNRLGHGGRTFSMWKFRTMVGNSTEVLHQCLANHPELQEEWATTHKLRNDPRITRVGRALRKASLDELPQLWNVVRGEMSLVGPRPIVDAEVAKYHAAYAVYVKTVPGLTGLWQVSGRNRTTYAERIAYDTYYVRNWSVWMDLYLLTKTVGAVLSGDGAY